MNPSQKLWDLHNLQPPGFIFAGPPRPPVPVIPGRGVNMYNWPVSADQAGVKLVQLQKVVGAPSGRFTRHLKVELAKVRGFNRNIIQK